ncbi:hypothetical protein D3C81_1123350 [compost metagenome]
MRAAGVIQHRHAEAEVRTLRQRQANSAHPENADGFMMYIDAEPVGPNAALPLAGLYPFGHFHHPARCRQHQTHDGIGDGFGQHGRGMHQQHVMGIKRVDVEIVVTDGNG